LEKPISTPTVMEIFKFPKLVATFFSLSTTPTNIMVYSIETLEMSPKLATKFSTKSTNSTSSTNQYSPTS